MQITEEALNTLINEVLKNNNLNHSLINMTEYKTAVAMLINYLNSDNVRRFNANISIVADAAEIANRYGMALAEILEKVINNKRTVGIIDSDDELFKLRSFNDLKVAVVKNCTANSPDKLSEVLSNIEKDNWTPAVILCTTAEAVERLKEYESQDYRLYNYLCGLKIVVSDINVDNVYDLVIEKIGRNGFVITEEFCKKLKLYIKAVYAGASLQKEAFVDDLISRIYREHYKKLDAGMELLAIDIPYSIKAENVYTTDNYDVIDKLVVASSTEDNETDTMNILITNVSTVNANAQLSIYKDEQGNCFSGLITNEAPIKSIAHRLGKRGSYLDKIIFIESNTVQTGMVSVEGKKYSHIEFLKYKIDNFLGDNKKHTKYIDVSIADEPTRNDVSETVFKIYEKLLSLISNDMTKKVNIYIEANGGVRYVLTMLLSLTKTLENYNKNIRITEITSMVYDTKKKNPISIINSKDVFDTSQIIGIVDEFVNYGRTGSLRRYIEGYMHELSEDKKEEVRRVLDKLYKVSDDIQLCRTYMILEDFYGENNLRTVIDEFIKKYINPDNYEQVPAIISIFIHILKLIENELNQIVYKDFETDNEVNVVVYLPNMIEWCIDKSFVQQALTFCAERLPEYLFEITAGAQCAKIQLNGELRDVLQNTSTGKYEKNYYFIAHIHEFLRQIKATRINKIIDIIKCNGKINILGPDDWTDALVETDLSNAEETDELKGAASKIENMLCDYNKYSNNISTLGKRELEQIFVDNQFDVNDLNQTVKISNKIANNTLMLTMRGKYISDDNGNNEIPHPKLGTQKERIVKILSVLAQILIDKMDKDKYTYAKDCYDEIIDGLFASDFQLCQDLKDRYSELQSKKFYLGEALDAGYILTDRKDKIQKLMYLYSICKEQRNLSNHAHVSENDKPIALDTIKLKKVIQELLIQCN